MPGEQPQQGPEQLLVPGHSAPAVHHMLASSSHLRQGGTYAKVIIMHLNSRLHQHASRRLVDPLVAASFALLAQRPSSPDAVFAALQPMCGSGDACGEQSSAVVTYPYECAERVRRRGERDCGRELLQPDETVGADEECVFGVLVAEVRDAGGDEWEESATCVGR